jgi:site-specific DNA-methyltransferase (adenine-specific)
MSAIIPKHEVQGALINLAEGRRFLAEARDVLAVLDYRDKLAAIERYLRQRDDSDGAARDAAELRLWAERRLGEMLWDTVVARGDHGPGLSGSGPSLPPGINKHQSSRYQRAKELPVEDFVRHIRHAREANDIRGLTSAAINRLAKAAIAGKWGEAEDGAAARVGSLPDGCRIEAASMQDFLPTLAGVDLILTDPPYPEEFLPLYGDLARLAPGSLAEGGVLAVMCGQYHLPAVLARMTPHIGYRWTMAYLTPGGQAAQVFSQKVNAFWKPVLIFGGAGRWLADVVRSAVNDNDKRFHEWGQSFWGMAALVRALSKPGQLVVDPFLGGGATAAAALSLGRRFAGCDIHPGHVETTRARLARAFPHA